MSRQKSERDDEASVVTSLGNFGLGAANSQLSWNADAFRTENTGDIINVASTTVLGQGFFVNAAKTLRQGVEAGVTLKANPWNVYANYTFVDATFQTAMTPVAEQSVCRRQRKHLRHAGRPHSEHSGALFQSGRRICRH